LVYGDDRMLDEKGELWNITTKREYIDKNGGTQFAVPAGHGPVKMSCEESAAGVGVTAGTLRTLHVEGGETLIRLGRPDRLAPYLRDVARAHVDLVDNDQR
jgi:hypothetical protein